MWYWFGAIDNSKGVGSAASARLERARRFGGGVRVRSTTSRSFVDALKGRGVKGLGVTFESLGRFRDMACGGCFGGGEPLEIPAGSSSSMTTNLGEADGLLFGLEATGVRLVAKGRVVCWSFLLGVQGSSTCKLPARARRDCPIVGLLGDALARFEGDGDLNLEGEEVRLEPGLVGWLEAAVDIGKTQKSVSLREFGSSTFLFGGISECADQTRVTSGVEDAFQGKLGLVTPITITQETRQRRYTKYLCINSMVHPSSNACGI
jgi:hypothetical protein